MEWRRDTKRDSRRTINRLGLDRSACDEGNLSGDVLPNFLGDSAGTGEWIDIVAFERLSAENLGPRYPFRPLKSWIVPITSEIAIDSSSQA